MQNIHNKALIYIQPDSYDRYNYIIMFRTVHDDDWKPMFKQGTIDVSNEYSADNNFETEAFDISEELQNQILELL